MNPVTIEVTADDIEQGTPGEGTNPVALALRRATGIDWIVMYCMIAVERNPPHRAITLPREVSEQLKEFEQTRTMQPLTIELKVPV